MEGIVHIICNGAEEYWLDAENIESVKKTWFDYRQGGHSAYISYKDGVIKEFNGVIMVVIEHNKGYCEEVEAEERLKELSEYENDKVMVVYNEIDRLDVIDRDERKKAILKLHPQTTEQFQKKGLGVRFLNACRYYSIDTVGQLLEFGRVRFDRSPNIGRTCIDAISEALKNLYGIEKW